MNDKKQYFRNIQRYSYFKNQTRRIATFSKAYKGMDRERQKIIQLCKVNSFQQNQATQIQAIKNRLEQFKNLNLKNIVKIIEVIYQQSRFYIATNLSDNTLFNIMNKMELQQAKLIDIIDQIVKGMCQLSKKQIHHNFLNPSNIIITKTKKVLLTDYAIGQVYEQYSNKKLHQNIHQQLLHYISPQILNGKKNCNKASVWSLGVILAECIFGKNIFTNTGHLLNIITQQKNIVQLLSKRQSRIKSNGLINFLFRNLLIFQESARSDWKTIRKQLNKLNRVDQQQQSTLIQNIQNQNQYTIQQNQIINNDKDKDKDIRSTASTIGNISQLKDSNQVKKPIKIIIKPKIQPINQIKCLIKIKKNPNREKIDKIKEEILQLKNLHLHFEKQELVYSQVLIHYLILRSIQLLINQYSQLQTVLTTADKQYLITVENILKNKSILLRKLQAHQKYNVDEISQCNLKNFEEIRQYIYQKWKARRMARASKIEWNQKMKYFENMKQI